MSLRDRITIDRIEFLVDDADYPSAEDAVDDPWRVALLASLPAAARGREAARLAAVRATNERRVPRARAAHDDSPRVEGAAAMNTQRDEGMQKAIATRDDHGDRIVSRGCAHTRGGD